MLRKLFIIFCIILMIIFTSCGIKETQYNFPPKLEDMENLLAEQGLNWELDDTFNYEDNSSERYLFLNEDGLEFSIYSTIYESTEYESEKGMSVSWYLPKELTIEQTKEFYYKELPKVFDLISILYGNTKELKSSLNEFIKYYEKAEGNFEGDIYWTKRAGNNHIRINTRFQNNKLGLLNINTNKVYEEVILQSKNEIWKNTAKIDSIEISDSTVAKIKEVVISENKEDLYGKHFIIHGRLQNIKSIKTVPDSLMNIKSSFLKSNKDKYLSATLVDDTGEINVYLQMTSLNDDELKMERDHHVVLLYYEHDPFFIVRFSVLSE